MESGEWPVNELTSEKFKAKISWVVLVLKTGSKQIEEN